MSIVDLHIHSSYSDDGELTPSQITSTCRAQGIALAAITDHNSVRGVAEALATAHGVRIVPGIELDCSCGGKNFHLLGYGFDYTQPVFAEIEQDILQQEQAAAAQKMSLFSEATGIELDTKAILHSAPDGIVTGEMIAEHLLARADAAHHPLLAPYLPGGTKSDMPHVRFYWDFFSQGKVAYLPIRYLALADAVALLHRFGGIAVLAHPGQNLDEGDPLLVEIIAAGIDGIEAFSSYHRPADTQHYLQIAEQHKLTVTCGSDFHGKHKPHIALGGHGATWDNDRLLTELHLLTN